ncbi:hypothetical protein Q1695_004888 [Nippostrongylus brasiliensis]|nr:hypothetical protein Q1695_004888 [Nippostrongylus brasiliensis]
MSLNVLFAKIRRMLEIRELDRTSELEAHIVTIIYYNATMSRRISLSSARVFYATCETAAEPSQVSVEIGDFRVTVEPLSLAQPLNDVVCLGYAFLYEDLSSFRALLQYYSQRSDLMVLYAGSITDELYAESRSYESKIEIVPWPLFSKKSVARESNLSMDLLMLNEQALRSSQQAAFADCWLRFAPIAQRITVADISAVRLPSKNDHDNTNSGSVFKLLHPSWSVKQLISHKVAHNRYDGLVLVEHCYTRVGTTGERSDCEKMEPGQKPFGRNINSTTIPLRKSTAHSAATDSYQRYLRRCLHHRPQLDDRPTVMKLEFDLEQKRQDTDPCQLRLRRDNLKCRVAVDYSSLMFRERMKISLVKKRSILLFSQGCHL